MLRIDHSDRKESETQEKVDRYLQYQHSQTVLLGALYQLNQRVQAQNTPGKWIPKWINVGTGVQLVPSNPMRRKVILMNYGPSDLFLSAESFQDPAGTVISYTGSENITLNFAVLKVGDPPLELSTSGPLYGLPTLWNSGSNENAQVSIYEELFVPVADPTDSNGLAGSLWTGTKLKETDDGFWHLIRELI